MMSMVVVLPAPLGPRNATISPDEISRSTSLTAWTVPKLLCTPRKAIAAGWLPPAGRRPRSFAMFVTVMAPSWQRSGVPPTVSCHLTPMTTVMVPRPGGTPGYREGRRLPGVRVRGSGQAGRSADGEGPGDAVRGVAGRSPGVLRGPRGRQLQGLLDRAQGGLRGQGAPPDDRPGRGAGRRVRRGEDLPSLPGRPVQPGQVPVQDAHRRPGRHRLRPAVRGRAGRRGRHVHDVAHPARPLPAGGPE